MTKEQKKEWTVATLFGVLLLWLLWFLLKPHNQEIANNEPLPTFPVAQTEPLTAPNINIIGAPPIQLPGSCGCDACSSCPSSPFTVGGINQILANGAAVSNAIIAYGNATLDAIAAQDNAVDPLTKVTVG